MAVGVPLILRLSILNDGGQELSFAQSELDADSLPDDPAALATDLAGQIIASPGFPALRESLDRRKKLIVDTVTTKMTNGKA